MDREYIVANDIIGQYVAGRLSDEEAASFEEFYFEYEDIALEVESELMLSTTLKDAAFGGTIGAGTRPRRQFFTGPLFAAAATVLLAATLTLSGFLIFQNHSAMQQVNLLKERIARFEQPSVAGPVLQLVQTRSVSESAPNVLVVPDSPPGSYTFTISVPPPHSASYQLSLEGAGDLLDWTREGVRPDADGEIFLQIPTALLRSGTYVVRVESARAGGQKMPVAAYELQIRR